MVKDYKNYDYFSASLKTENENEMVLSYAAFGWEAVERGEDKRFSDYVSYTFRRPHKIENKDRLQFLQVKMEQSINLAAKLRRRRHSVSAVRGIALIVIAVLLVAGGTALACIFRTPAAISWGAIAAVCGAITIPVAVRWIVKRAVRENIIYNRLLKESETELKNAVTEAAALSGGIR